MPHIIDVLSWRNMPGRYDLCLLSLYLAGDALPLLDIVTIALDMAKGLHELHTERIVFQDLKPHK